MRQRINLSQAKLDELAEKTDELSDWLEEKTLQIASHIVIPPGVAVVGSILVVAGLTLFMDEAIPDGVCWSGCQLPS